MTEPGPGLATLHAARSAVLERIAGGATHVFLGASADGRDVAGALVALTGNFSMTCLTANVFDVDPPAEQPVPLAP